MKQAQLPFRFLAHKNFADYGQMLHFWDLNTHELLQDIDLGQDGIMPFEIRFLHDPERAEGYVCAALSSNIFRFYRTGVSSEHCKQISSFLGGT